MRAYIEVGDYKKDISAAISGVGGIWSECAEQIVKDLEAWASANRDAVLSRRGR